LSGLASAACVVAVEVSPKPTLSDGSLLLGDTIKHWAPV